MVFAKAAVAKAKAAAAARADKPEMAKVQAMEKEDVRGEVPQYLIFFEAPGDGWHVERESLLDSLAADWPGAAYTGRAKRCCSSIARHR